MAIDDQIERLERITPLIPPCRCCGKALSILDGITEAVREGVGIHTRCIPQHWGKHSKHINNARCREFQDEECDHETSVASTSYPPWDGYQCIKCGALFDEEMEPYNQKGE